MNKIKNNKKILEFACNFKEITEKEKWVSRYDSESDSFYFTVLKLPPDARIKYFTDEFAFYLTKDEKIKGLFIEYFKSNFVKHHKEFNELLKETGKKDSKKTVVKIEKNKMSKMANELENIIEMSLVENVKNVEFQPI